MSTVVVLRGASAGLLLLPAIGWAQAAPSDFTSATRYDAARRVTGTIASDPDGAGPLHYLAMRNSYDAAGRLIRVETGELSGWQSEQVAPIAWSGFSIQMQVDTSYDAMSRKTLEVTSSGTSSYTATQYSYNDQGLLECTAVRMNPAVYGSLPANACTLGAEGSQGSDRIMRNEYDAAGQLLKVQKAYATGLQQDYATYTYSANGKRLSVKDANGNLASMSYDGFDRQSQWNFPSKTNVGSVSSEDYEAYGYDANGNRTSFRKRDGRTVTFAYDALNRMTSKAIPEGCAPIGGGTCPGADRTRDVYYGYDLRGLQTWARFDGPTGTDGVISHYDGFGQLVSSETSMYGMSRTLTFQYDANGNRVRTQFPDGAGFTYTYDGLDRPLQGFTTTGSQYNFKGYDAAGRLASIYGGAVTYDYDGANRLTTQSMADLTGGGNANTTSLAYNPASQIVSKMRSNDAYAWTGAVNVDRSYAVNGLNQYMSAGSASFSYDANGNLIGDGRNSYAYDADNRMTIANGDRYIYYDALGRLWSIASGQSGVTQFLYDGSRVAAEYDGAGNLMRRYAHGVGEDTPEVGFEGSGLGDPRYLFADHQGSVVATFAPSLGRTAVNAYDEYGIPDQRNTGRFGYTGQAWIPELGMWFYKARFYSPTLGRFMQTDPIGYDDQINLYAYVANDPVNGRDPTGLWTCEECSKDGLKVAKAFVSGVQDAADMKGASAELKAVSASLGKFGEAGVNVGFGSLDAGTLGQQAGANVTLDAGQIVSASKDIQRANGISPRDALRAVGAATVAHETQHYNDRNILNRDNQTLRKEMRGYRVQNETMMRLGVDGNGYDHRYPYDMNVRRQGLGSCTADLISNGYSSSAAQASCSNQ